MNMKKLKGFTILELIIVIAIIAIMCMVLVPNIGEMIKDSRMQAANEQAHEIYLAAQDYLTELQLSGAEPFGTDIQYVVIGNNGTTWSGSEAHGMDPGHMHVTDVSVMLKGLEMRMGGDFVQDKNAACVIAFYPKTFTVKHVVYCSFKDSLSDNLDNVVAIGGGNSGGSFSSENLYDKRFGDTGHTQEHDYRRPNASDSHAYTGQFPIH